MGIMNFSKKMIEDNLDSVIKLFSRDTWKILLINFFIDSLNCDFLLVEIFLAYIATSYSRLGFASDVSYLNE